MSKQDSPYRRLTPTRMLPLGYASLWVAEDHLLQVNSGGYSETYRRFYYKDIQGFLIVESSLLSTVHIVTGAVGLLAVLITFGFSRSLLASLCVALLFAGIALWNHLLGPGCKVHVVTRIQQTRLTALGRRRRVDRVLAELRARIEAAQGGLRQPAPHTGSPAEGDTSAAAPQGNE